jgi:hypothetical protein
LPLVNCCEHDVQNEEFVQEAHSGGQAFWKLVKFNIKKLHRQSDDMDRLE